MRHVTAFRNEPHISGVSAEGSRNVSGIECQTSRQTAGSNPMLENFSVLMGCLFRLPFCQSLSSFMKKEVVDVCWYGMVWATKAFWLNV